MDVVVNSDCLFLLNAQQPIKGHADYYLNIFKCLGYADNEPPVAELLRLYHGLQGQWLVVTPIYWQASHNDAMLLACKNLFNSNDADARILFDVFSTFVAGYGMSTHFHDAHTWLLQCDGKPPITAIPPHRSLHQSITTSLKLLDSTLFWQRFLTEIQMLLSLKIKNLPQVNGVWIWGAGNLGTPSNRPILVKNQQQYDVARILSNHPGYFLNTKPGKNALLLFDSLNQDEISRIESQLKSYSTNWYWNNVAYHSRKSSWFSNWTFM